jgi:hypothetical protein
MAVEAAMGYVSAWLGQPNVSHLVPGRRHIEIASGLLHGVGTGGNLTTDVQLAALALESDATCIRMTRISPGSRACAGSTYWPEVPAGNARQRAPAAAARQAARQMVMTTLPRWI